MMIIFQFIIKYIELLKNLIFKPQKVFEKNYLDQNSFCIFVSAIIGGVGTLIKSFQVQSLRINFFVNENLNDFFSLMNNPQVQWALCYLGYAVFYVIVIICGKKMFRSENTKIIVMSILSVGVLGLMLALIITIINLLFHNIFFVILTYLFYLWILSLSILAIKKSINISLFSALIVFIVAFIPVFIFCGLPGIFPFFLWLRY